MGRRRAGRRAVRPAERRRRRAADAMRILIDILHPAHVHFFRNFHGEMTGRGHELCITARDKDRSLELLERVRPSVRAALGAASRRAWAWSPRCPSAPARLLKVMKRFRPDVMTGIMGPSIARGRRRPAGPGGRLLRHRVRPPDQLVRLPARPQRVHAGLLPGQGAGHAIVTLRRLPRARLPPSRTASRPTPTGWRRSASAPDEPFSSCASSPGRRCTTARRRASTARPEA